MGRQHIADPLLDNYGEFDPVNLINPYSFAAGAFDPLSISGCVLWLKADGSCYNTGTTQATDGQTVETWADASASSASVTQSTSGKRPLFKTNIVNSNKPVLRFDGTDDALGIYTAILDSLSAGTLFFVSKADADPAVTGGGAAVGRMVGDGQDETGTYTDGNVYYGWGSTTRKSCGNPTPSFASWRVHSVRSASGDWNYRIDGSAFYSTATNSWGATGNTPRGYIGAGGDSLFWKGDVAEVLIYNTALGTTDREAVETYLGGKYAITITH